MMTRREWKRQTLGLLSGTEAPAWAAELLLCHVLGLERPALIAHDSEVLREDEEARLNGLRERRLRGEPLAYLLGHREFYGRSMEVNRFTLIPRPETEDLVNAALDAFDAASAVRFLDIGTGSGCIAVTLAAERPLWSGAAVDISEEALAAAWRNARRWAVAERLAFLKGDVTEPLPFEAESFDLIVSNPPYVTEDEYARLAPEVRDFEPRTALAAGPSGLTLASAVVGAARRLLKPGGRLFMEHGWLQGGACRSLCEARDWEAVCTGRDLAGRDRFLSAVRKSRPETQRPRSRGPEAESRQPAGARAEGD